MDKKQLIAKLDREGILPADDLAQLLRGLDSEETELLSGCARRKAVSLYGKSVYIRGIVEFTNYCRNDCRYCGIRCSNTRADRYRLSKNEILSACEGGYRSGFRTFVLQGGEDMHYTDSDICEIVKAIKDRWPECAVTLSIGERSRSGYESYYAAGADRFLLRQETSSPSHYAYLHPETMSLANRKRCLDDLKDIGYQTGCGIMVGSPGQTIENIVQDLLYMKDFVPHMIGIGPFIPHKDTPFANEPAGDAGLCLRVLSITRLMLPKVLLPSTTALGTAVSDGRLQGILAGANVIMPNITPPRGRCRYILYDGQIGTEGDTQEDLKRIGDDLKSIGYFADMGRGDSIM